MAAIHRESGNVLSQHMISSIENVDEFRPLIQLASDILQDTIGLANQSYDSDGMKNYAQVLTPKMIQMISLLSHVSINQANAMKQLRRHEKKSMKYIESLRKYVVSQNDEILKMRIKLSDLEAEKGKSEVFDAATNTDAPTVESQIGDLKYSFDEERMKYQNDITVLQETVMNLKSSKKLLQKELGKAKLMLRTQQILLDEIDNPENSGDHERHYPLNSHAVKSRQDGLSTVGPISDAEEDGEASRSNIQKLRIVPPFEATKIAIAPDLVDFAVARLTNRAHQNFATLDSLDPIIQEHQPISSPIRYKSGTKSSTRYQENSLRGDDEINSSSDSIERVQALEQAGMETSDMNNEIDALPDQVSTTSQHISSSFSENSAAFLDMVDERTNSLEQSHDISAQSQLKVSGDSFALIADYYDDYFREHAGATIDNDIDLEGDPPSEH